MRSSVSISLASSLLYGLTRSVKRTPTICERLVRRAMAWRFGPAKPRLSAIASILLRWASLTLGWPLSARETVVCETPASFAIGVYRWFFMDFVGHVRTLRFDRSLIWISAISVSKMPGSGVS